MSETKKIEKEDEKVELLELKFVKSTFTTPKGIVMPLLERYSGNGLSVGDGETVEAKPELAVQMLYNFPDNFELISKGKTAEDVTARAKAHLANRFKRQKAAKKEIDDKAAKLKAEQNKAFSK